jgi:hypothetical protein
VNGLDEASMAFVDFLYVIADEANRKR